MKNVRLWFVGLAWLVVLSFASGVKAEEVLMKASIRQGGVLVMAPFIIVGSGKVGMIQGDNAQFTFSPTTQNDGTIRIVSTIQETVAAGVSKTITLPVVQAQVGMPITVNAGQWQIALTATVQK